MTIPDNWDLTPISGEEIARGMIDKNTVGKLYVYKPENNIGHAVLKYGDIILATDGWDCQQIVVIIKGKERGRLVTVMPASLKFECEKYNLKKHGSLFHAGEKWYDKEILRYNEYIIGGKHG